MVEEAQISFLDALFPSEKLVRRTTELCKTWKSAIRNNNGVFTEGSMVFPAGVRQRHYLELKLAMLFPFVYGDICLEAGSYGAYSPVSGNKDWIEFNVYDDADEVREYLQNRIKSKINRNKNLSANDCAQLDKLTESVIEKALESMTKEPVTEGNHE